MCVKYYEPKDTSSKEFSFGDININYLSSKEKYPGLIVRKLEVTRNGITRKITHVQELKWEDNSRPDKTEGINAYERLQYMITETKKHRERNPKGSVVVHCR